MLLSAAPHRERRESSSTPGHIVFSERGRWPRTVLSGKVQACGSIDNFRLSIGGPVWSHDLSEWSTNELCLLEQSLRMPSERLWFVEWVSSRKATRCDPTPSRRHQHLRKARTLRLVCAAGARPSFAIRDAHHCRRSSAVARGRVYGRMLQGTSCLVLQRLDWPKSLQCIQCSICSAAYEFW